MALTILGYISAVLISISSVILVDFLKKPRLILENKDPVSDKRRNEKREKLAIEVRNIPWCYKLTNGFWKGRASTNCSSKLSTEEIEMLCEHEDSEDTHCFEAALKKKGRWGFEGTPHQYQVMKTENKQKELLSIPNNLLSESISETNIAPGESEDLYFAERIEGRDYFYMVSASGYTKIQKRSFRESGRTGLPIPDSTEIVAEIDTVEPILPEGQKITQYGRMKINEEEVRLEIQLTDSSGYNKTKTVQIKNKKDFKIK